MSLNQSDLSFIGTAYPYLLNTSITVRIYLNPLLKEEKACMSTNYAGHISSLLKTITDRLANFLLIGLCNSSANFSFQFFFFFFLPKPSWYLVPIIVLTIKFFATFSPNVLRSPEDNLPYILYITFAFRNVTAKTISMFHTDCI